MSLYPMKFMPLFKNKIWGGNHIQKDLGFDYKPLPNCGEMWILSSVAGSESVIDNGFLKDNTLNEALEIYMTDLVGEHNYQRFGNTFPLLIKIIDANDKLSIQVHPDDALAQQRGMENGKTEMWYILHAAPGAKIIDGFEHTTTREEYQQMLECNQLEQLLHVEYPTDGDTFFIPAGRVHALGAGLLLAEIQQNSDCTYRLYDYNRPDTDGKLRELHTREALDAISFEATTDGKVHYDTTTTDSTTPLVQCPYFTTNLLSLTRPIKKDFSNLDSFVVYLCTRGIAAIHSSHGITPFRTGECVLIPACMDSIELFPQGNATLLEIYIDPKQYSGELRHANDLDWMAQYIGHEA